MDGSGKPLHYSNMPRLRPASSSDRLALGPSLSAAPLPTYALYGEQDGAAATDRLHCESIADRSQRHDWEIRPHRHETLFQILHIEHGHATAWLDGESLSLDGPCLLALPALVPHGFRFAPDVRGTVLTVLEPHLVRLLQDGGTLAPRLAQPICLRWRKGDAAAGAVAGVVARLRDEFHADAPWRGLALDAALLQLAVWLGRLAPAASDAGQDAAPSRALAHVQRYRALVEAQFRQQPSLAELAALLGITPTQLNRVCHRVLGHAALGVLHRRLVLEAQRDLAYTTLAVKQIALGLGFTDAGYFTRFFQRHTGHTPTRWRALAAR